MKSKVARGFAIALLACCSVSVAAAENAAIASAHPIATQVGLDVLNKGGNAFDAAVAVAAALAVVEPFSSGLGGGGFFLLHRSLDKYEVVVDARETAPGAANEQTYAGADGKPDGRRALDGAQAAGIPGTPAGLDWIAKKYGRLALKDLLQPAIALARDGFPVDSRYIAAATFREPVMRSDPNTAAIFLDQGKVPGAGFIVKQPQLAVVLEAMANSGRAGFYQGDVARRMVAGVVNQGGIWALADLENYQVIERAALSFRYRSAKVTCVTLPSSGCLVMAQALQILQGFDVANAPVARRSHLLMEALRRGYQDRVRYMGDPGFVEVPSAKLASAEYAQQRAKSIDPARASTSEALDMAVKEGSNTTHFSIVDAEGNRVAATLSVNLPFGSGVVAGDTGVLLNDEMSDFAISPSAATAYSLTGSAANALAPGKRPLSSMTPTFVEDDEGLLVIGTPGGSRIISMLLLAVVDFMEARPRDLERVVSLPRFHHQYLPDRVEYEPGAFDKDWIEALKAMGHNVQEGKRRWGNMQAVYVDKRSGTVKAYSDPRGKSGVLF
ncbi:MAG: gamma-glutamyltransferase [Burkholderiales bacterium]